MKVPLSLTDVRGDVIEEPHQLARPPPSPAARCSFTLARASSTDPRARGPRLRQPGEPDVAVDVTELYALADELAETKTRVRKEVGVVVKDAAEQVRTYQPSARAVRRATWHARSQRRCVA